jgi:hypothetical protein
MQGVINAQVASNPSPSSKEAVQVNTGSTQLAEPKRYL